ncbi:MAG: DUF1614 domain-containing protein [Candidatus Binatia bacterium]|nr:DUF1614 domain-containing protein [Candidatus Binatia bacterium]
MTKSAKPAGPAGPAAQAPAKIELTPGRLGLMFAAAGLLGILEVGALDFAYDKLGVPHRYFFGLLFASWIGSMLNLPLFTMAPVEGEGPDAKPTVVAINVGGAIVPMLLSFWVISQQANPAPVLLSLLVVTGVTYLIATPVKGVGIAMPMFIPPLAAAGAALVLAPTAPAAAAYAGGTLGALLGADILNLPGIRTLGAPIVSIGGAGTFDGVFLTGLIAVLLAGA